jgi:hypothetical protein
MVHATQNCMPLADYFKTLLRQDYARAGSRVAQAMGRKCAQLASERIYLIDWSGENVCVVETEAGLEIIVRATDVQTNAEAKMLEYTRLGQKSVHKHYDDFKAAYDAEKQRLLADRTAKAKPLGAAAV